MIHLLTMGHFAPGNPKTAAVEKALDAEVVNRLLIELGAEDAAGKPTLDGAPVKFRGGVAAVPWKAGLHCNRAAEEFALRLQAETGCAIVDREHSRVIEPGRLEGVGGHAAGRSRR